MRKSRFLSILLSISMVLSLATFAASADGGMTWSELQGAIDSAESGATINLGSEYITAQSEDSCLCIGEDTKVTMNLNGTYLGRNCYSGAKSDGNVFVVYGELTLTGTGSITAGYSTGYGGGIYIAAGGKVTIDGNIELYNCKSEADGGGIYVVRGGELVLNDAQLDGNYVYGSNQGGSIYVENGASISVSGNTGISGYRVVDENTSVNSGIYLEPGVTINAVGSLSTSRNICVTIGNGHDGIIASGSALSQSTYWKFACDDKHGYSIELNASNQVVMKERIYHNVYFIQSEYGTLSMSNTEIEVGGYGYINVTPAAGYCITAMYEDSSSAGDSTPTEIKRYYGETARYTIMEMPDRDITIVADWMPVEDTVIVKAANLNLSGRISLNIKLAIPEAIANDADAKVKITYQGSSKQVSLNSLEKEGDLYVVSNPCTVREFACPVAIQVLDGDGNVCVITKDSTKAYCINEETAYEWVDGKYTFQTGEVGTINEFTYSVEDYKYAVKRGSDNKLKDLIHCLNNYSAYAWSYFSVTKDIDDHGFVFYTDAESFDSQSEPYIRSLNSITADSLAVYAPEYGANITGISAEGMYLTLESDTTINIHFTLADGYTKDDFTFSCGNHKLVVEQDGNSIIVKLNGINAKQLDTTYTITVSNGTESMDVKCSALSYAYLALSAPEGSLPAATQAALRKLVRAMKLYSDAANTYFG